MPAAILDFLSDICVGQILAREERTRLGGCEGLMLDLYSLCWTTRVDLEIPGVGLEGERG